MTEHPDRPVEELDLRRRPLGPPRVADPRPLTRRGGLVSTFLRVERWLAHRLSRDLLPLVPGLSRLYDLQLRRGLTLVEGTIDLPSLPAAWEGRRLLLLSDLHAGPFVSPKTLNAVCRRLSQEPIDLVVIAGDFVSSSLEELQALRPGLSHLVEKAPTFGVLGNHDHYTDEPDRLLAELASDGVTLLQNRSVDLSRNGQALHLLGIDDWRAGDPQLERALEGVEGAGTKILISHSPDSFFAAVERGIDLVLSGHTHGGQIRIPGGTRLVRPSRYRLLEGHYLYRTSQLERSGQLILSQGIGVVAVPVRWRCPPEATLLRLRCGKPG